jgi:hypothetical protein
LIRLAVNALLKPSAGGPELLAAISLPQGIDALVDVPEAPVVGTEVGEPISFPQVIDVFPELLFELLAAISLPKVIGMLVDVVLDAPDPDEPHHISLVGGGALLGFVGELVGGGGALFGFVGELLLTTS